MHKAHAMLTFNYGVSINVMPVKRGIYGYLNAEIAP